MTTRNFLIVLIFIIFSCEKRGNLEEPQDLNAVRFTISIQNQGVLSWTDAMIEQFVQPSNRELEFQERAGVDDTTWTRIMQRSQFSFTDQEPHSPFISIEYWSLDPESNQSPGIYVKGEVVRTRMRWQSLTSDQKQQEALSSYLNFGFPAGIFTFEDRKDVELKFSHGLPSGHVAVRVWESQGYENTFFIAAGIVAEVVDGSIVWFHEIDIEIIFEGRTPQQRINWNPKGYTP